MSAMGRKLPLPLRQERVETCRCVASMHSYDALTRAEANHNVESDKRARYNRMCFSGTSIEPSCLAC